MLVREWKCWACLIEGKVPGDIIAHLEDYSNPIDGAIWLCYRCHTVLHARFDKKHGWDSYREQVRNGIQWPLIKSYHRVLEEHYYNDRMWLPKPVNKPRQSTILDEIDSGALYPEPEAYERMKQIHEQGFKFFKNKEQESLF